MKIWNRDTLLLLALIVSGAAWAVVHVALFLRTLRLERVPAPLRWLSWLPPLTPIAGFWGGRSGWAVAWCVVAATYLVLRSLS